MSTTYTPRPWAFSCEDIDPRWAVVTAFGGLIVANVNDVNNEHKQSGNAQLIAAAPDLLEALQAMVEGVTGVDQTSAVNMASAAIAKATGVNP